MQNCLVSIRQKRDPFFFNMHAEKNYRGGDWFQHFHKHAYSRVSDLLASIHNIQVSRNMNYLSPFNVWRNTVRNKYALKITRTSQYSALIREVHEFG